MRHAIALGLSIGFAVLIGTCRMAASAEQAAVLVGAAVVDITPDYPIRLMGYGNRQTESEGIVSRLKARALAIGGDEGDGPSILVAVDNCAVGAKITEDVAARLKTKVGLTFRYSPAVRYLKDMVASGDLGTPYFYNAYE